jgi:hypothetical protein
MADDVFHNAALSPPAPDIHNDKLQHTQDSNMSCDDDLHKTTTQKDDINKNYFLSTNSPPDTGANNAYLTQPIYTTSPTPTQIQAFTFGPHTPLITKTNLRPRVTTTLRSPVSHPRFGRGFHQQPNYFNNTRVMSALLDIPTEMSTQDNDIDENTSNSSQYNMDTNSEVSRTATKFLPNNKYNP